MDYRKMVEEAQKKGLTNEKKMWDSVEAIAEAMASLKDAHPELWRKQMRRQHEILFGGHYSKEWAEEDLKELRWTDREGRKHEGPMWSMEEVEQATQGMSFPAGTTNEDKWVAMNVMMADVGRVLTDSDVLKAGHAFFFADEDWKPSDASTKIWEYMSIAKE